MQMLKKSVAIVLSILMLLSMMTIVAGMSAFAADGHKVTVTSAQNLFTSVSKVYKPGDAFDVVFYAKAKEKLLDGTIYLNYDSNSVAIIRSKGKYSVDVSPKMDFTPQANYDADNKRFRYSYSTNAMGIESDFTTEDVLFTFHFKAAESFTADATINIDINYFGAAGTKYSAEDECDVVDDTKLYTYIKNNEVTPAYKDDFSVRATLTGGTDVVEPDTQSTTSTDGQGTLADGFYLIGTKTDWNVANLTSANKFGANPHASGEYMLGTTLQEGEGIKVVKVEGGEAKTWYPEGDGTEYTVDAAHAGKVTIYFQETEKGDWSAFGGYFYVAPDSTPSTDPTDNTESVELDDGFYLIGTKTDWNVANLTSANKFSANDEKPGEYMLETTLEEGEGIKVVKVEGGAAKTWYPENEGTEYKVDADHAGKVTIYFQETENADWSAFGGYFFVTEGTEPDTSGNDDADYYLVGYINGADYGSEGDADNLGDYKFENGTVKAKFDEKSYVFVKTGDNKHWFMADGYPGDDATEAVLYDADEAKLGERANKLPVPGDVEVTFTLVKNGDGTLTLSYTAAEATEETEYTSSTDSTEETGSTAATSSTDSTEDTGSTADTSSTEDTGSTVDTSSTDSTEGTGDTTDTSSTEETGDTTDTSATSDTQAETVPEMYTFFYQPSAEQLEAKNTFKLYIKPTADGEAVEYTFEPSALVGEGDTPIYKVSVPKDYDDVAELKYEVFDGDKWAAEQGFKDVKLSDYANKIVKADGTVGPEPVTEPETTASTEETGDTTDTSSTEETGDTTDTSATSATEADTTAPETTVPETTIAPATQATQATEVPQPATAAPAKELIPPSKVDFSKNPDVDSAVNAISKAKSDDDPKGSKFSGLKAKVAKTTKNSNKITWTKVSGAKKYIVMGNKCGKTNGKINSFKKLKTTTGKNFTQKKLKKGTYYKYLVLAVNAKGKVISASKVIHVATKGGKVTNYKSLKVNKTKIALKKGKTFKLKVTKKVKMAKKGIVKEHRKIKFESSNAKIASVSAKGKIKANKKGTCYVYAYAQNGVFGKIKVKVK